MKCHNFCDSTKSVSKYLNVKWYILWIRIAQFAFTVISPHLGFTRGKKRRFWSIFPWLTSTSAYHSWHLPLHPRSAKCFAHLHVPGSSRQQRIQKTQGYKYSLRKLVVRVPPWHHPLRLLLSVQQTHTWPLPHSVLLQPTIPHTWFCQPQHYSPDVKVWVWRLFWAQSARMTSGRTSVDLNLFMQA